MQLTTHLNILGGINKRLSFEKYIGRLKYRCKIKKKHEWKRNRKYYKKKTNNDSGKTFQETQIQMAPTNIST